MSRLVEFFQNHPVLCLAFVGIAGAAIFTTVQSISRGVRKVSPAEATRLINSDSGVVFDVRGDADFRGGHIIEAVNVPTTQIQQRASAIEKYKDRPVILACRTGQQSSAASATLRKQGFENLQVLAGGMLAWQEASMPVTKGA